MFNKIAIKIGLLVLMLFALNTIYTFTFFEKDLNLYSKEFLDIKNSQSNTDIYYFGESSNITYKQDDSTQLSISELCNQFYPTLKVTNVNKYATHAGVYKYWLKQIEINKERPKAVIITINLRSFDATWIHSKLETQLQQSLVLGQFYPNIINRFLLSLQAFSNKTEAEREVDMLNDWKKTKIYFTNPFQYQTVRQWDDAMANGGHKNADGTWDTKKIELACHYIKAYAFNIDEKNPRIKDFDEISAFCLKNNLPLYLNLMAENIEYADSLVGKELVLLMRENRDFLKARYHKNNCIVVDNLELVNGKHFIDQNWTTEHYNYKGRMLIAKNLATSLKQQFKTEYKETY